MRSRPHSAANAVANAGFPNARPTRFGSEKLGVSLLGLHCTCCSRLEEEEERRKEEEEERERQRLEEELARQEQERLHQLEQK